MRPASLFGGLALSALVQQKLRTLLTTLGVVFGSFVLFVSLSVRCGIEDTLWGRKGERMTSVQQIEQTVRIARELGREVATGKEAREIYRIGTTYKDADETLARLGWAPNRAHGQRGVPLRQAV